MPNDVTKTRRKIWCFITQIFKFIPFHRFISVIINCSSLTIDISDHHQQLGVSDEGAVSDSQLQLVSVDSLPVERLLNQEFTGTCYRQVLTFVARHDEKVMIGEGRVGVPHLYLDDEGPGRGALTHWWRRGQWWSGLNVIMLTCLHILLEKT